MKLTKPEVRLVARPQIDWEGLYTYVESVSGNSEWVGSKIANRADEAAPAAEELVEAAGRVCYRSWEPGLNPSVTRVRTDRADYLENILSSGHGSVLEHAQFSFAFRHVSRVVTHELVRHRAGTAVSQESMRYVRLDDITFWLPDWAKDDQVLMDAIKSHMLREEGFQKWLAGYFKLDEPGTTFEEKKSKTSFMRRFAPHGVATDLIWSANIRALRHIIETRTALGAEEEIRLVFGKVAKIMQTECPLLFADFEELPATKAWQPKWRKV